MDHSKHTRLTEAELTPENVEGAKIYGPDDETVGNVSHVHGMGTTMQVIIDVGGFLGIGSKTVSLDANRLEFMRDESGSVHATTTMTKDEMKALPEHSD